MSVEFGYEFADDDAELPSFTTVPVDAPACAAGQAVALRVNVVTGRSLAAYSALPREDEILLSPNSRFVVIRACQPEADGFHYVHMQQRAGEGVVF